MEPAVSIIAVITTDPSKVTGGAPIFICGGRDEMQNTSFTMEKILDAAAHEINPNTIIIVKH